MTFNKNIGLLDQVLRGGIGVFLIYLGFISSMIPDTFASILVGGFGIVNLVVSFIRVCPLYYIAGINTYHVD